MSRAPLSLTLLGETFAVARLGPRDPLPAWADAGALSSVTRTPQELSIVCEASLVPPEIPAVRDWRCLVVAGPLDFAEVGILASLSGALATAEVSLFAVSTYDTDYVLVRAESLDDAVEALRAEGHSVTA